MRSGDAPPPLAVGDWRGPIRLLPLTFPPQYSNLPWPLHLRDHGECWPGLNQNAEPIPCSPYKPYRSGGGWGFKGGAAGGKSSLLEGGRAVGMDERSVMSPEAEPVTCGSGGKRSAHPLSFDIACVRFMRHRVLCGPAACDHGGILPEGAEPAAAPIGRRPFHYRSRRCSPKRVGCPATSPCRRTGR